jgi:hypothetical protein
MTTLRKTPLTEYTLQCEYGQLTGVETLLGQFSGKIVAVNTRRFGFGWHSRNLNWLLFQQNLLISVVVRCNYTRLKNNPT